MVRSARKWIVSLLGVSMAFSALSSISDDIMNARRAYTKSVLPGIWHSNWKKCLDYAEKEGVPLIAVWSNGDFCGHCVNFEQCIMSPVFKDWMAKSGFVFYIGMVYDGSYGYTGGIGPSADGQEGYHGSSYYWCSNWHNLEMNWPFVRVYWKKVGKTAPKVDVVRSGGQIDGDDFGGIMYCSYSDNRTDAKNFIYPGDYKTYNPGGRRIIHTLTNDFRLSEYVPKPKVPPYLGGEFAVPNVKDFPSAGLEVEYGTTLENTYVPLSRTNTVAQQYASKNYVICNYPSGKAKTNAVEWVVGDKTKEMELKLAAGWLGAGPSTNYIEMILCDSNRVALATNYVACVNPKENSPKNPLWKGERNEETPLQPGEWTMDLVQAETAVKTWGDNAYTLVLVGGSLWCPDCVKTDTYLFDRPEFKEWTTSNGKKVALVSIDIPNMNEAKRTSETNSPCLLTRVKAEVSAGYIAADGSGEAARFQSGAGYLSRKGASSADVQAWLARNLDLAANRFNKLDPTNKQRPGVPTIYILRADDGSVAGRIAQFSDRSPTEWNENYIQRLDELLAQVAEKGEELNDSARTADDHITSRNRAGVKATLSFSDRWDNYVIDKAPKGTSVSFEVTKDGNEDVGDTRLILSVIDRTNSKVVAISTNKLSAGVSVSCELPSDSCAVQVTYPMDKDGYPEDAYFALDKAKSTVCAYKLTSDSVLNASQVKTVLPITDGEPEVMIFLDKDAQYRFGGLDDDKNEDVLYYDPVKKVYRAIESGPATLMLKARPGGDLQFEYQIWDPGSVEFVLREMTVRERGDDESSDFEYKIQVHRLPGVSGTAKARIFFVPNESRVVDDGTVFDWTDGQPFSWLEASNEVQTATIRIKGNPNADNEQMLVFRLANDGGDASLDETQRFVLKITDDDEANAGRIAMMKFATADDGELISIPAGRKVVAAAGGKVKVGISRIDGCDGLISAQLKVDGKAFGDLITWDKRESETKMVEIPLPASGEMTRIEVVGVDGALVEYAAKYLSVELVDENSARFLTEWISLQDLVRYVQCEFSIPVDKSTVGFVPDVTVALHAGSLPTGMSWRFDAENGEVVVSGVPTTAGRYSMSLQISENGKPGGLALVELLVSDPTTPGNEYSEALNPYLAVTRTFSDILVLKQHDLVGLLTLTIPPSGRLSAKFRTMAGETIPLLCESWLTCDAKGNYGARLDDARDLVKRYALLVGADNKGGIEVELQDLTGGDDLTCIVPETSWSAVHPATKWQGYYTVSMPCRPETEGAVTAVGAGFMTLKMSASGAVNAGKMAYAGILPNGRPYSGFGVLDEVEGSARLPVLCAMDTDVLSGVLKLDRTDVYRKVYPFEDIYPSWIHQGPDADLDSVQRLDVFGTAYDENSDLSSCCDSTFKSRQLIFFVQPELLPLDPGFSRGSPSAWSAENMTVNIWQKDGVSKMKLLDEAAARSSPGALTFLFDRKSGLVKGTCRLSFADKSSATLTYRGVVMPGWGYSSGCPICKEGGQEAIKRPFVSGACWFTDTFSDLEAGMDYSVRRSCPFSVGAEAGQ